MRPIISAALLFACGFAAATALADGGPFAAHNAYPFRFYPAGKFERALELGMRYVELDITYDAERDAAVVTHDAEPRGGEPLLADMVAQACRAWAQGPADDYTLIIDFKTASDPLVRDVKQVLESHAELLSKLPREPGGSFGLGKITVCLTGNSSAHRKYFDLVGADGVLLAFGDAGHGGWHESPEDHVPQEDAGFVRFLTYHFSVCADSAEARGAQHFSEERARRIMAAAEERGYRVRIYTLNPGRQENGDHDFTTWQRCVAAGVHMISTDALAIARRWWAEHGDRE